MKIEVKIILKDHYKENEDIGWSLPVEIDEFIIHPNDIEFEWEDGSTLPYNDFIYFGGDYYYRIFINGKRISELEGGEDETN